MTDEERDEIVLKVVEKVMLIMPETIGNLMAQHAANNKTRKQFYADNPSFEGHGDVVAGVMDKLEGKELGQDYDEILKEAVPAIAEQIKIKDGLNTTTVQNAADLTRTATGNFGEL